MRVRQGRHAEKAKSQEQKPKTEGGKPWRAFRPVQNKEHMTKVVGLETHMINTENANYVTQFKKLLDAITNYVQHEYKGAA